MDLFEAAERFVQNERDVVEEKVDKSNEKVDIEPEINLASERFLFLPFELTCSLERDAVGKRHWARCI